MIQARASQRWAPRFKVKVVLKLDGLLMSSLEWWRRDLLAKLFVSMDYSSISQYYQRFRENFRRYFPVIGLFI